MMVGLIVTIRGRGSTPELCCCAATGRERCIPERETQRQRVSLGKGRKVKMEKGKKQVILRGTINSRSTPYSCCRAGGPGRGGGAARGAGGGRAAGEGRGGRT